MDEVSGAVCTEFVARNAIRRNAFGKVPVGMPLSRTSPNPWPMVCSHFCQVPLTWCNRRFVKHLLSQKKYSKDKLLSLQRSFVTLLSPCVLAFWELCCSAVLSYLDCEWGSDFCRCHL